MRKGTETETLIDGAGVEVSVTYDWEREPIYLEECHGYHSISGGTDITLTEVMIVVAGEGVDILPRLNEKQKQTIIDNLLINS